MIAIYYKADVFCKWAPAMVNVRLNITHRREIITDQPGIEPGTFRLLPDALPTELSSQMGEDSEEH